MRIKGGLAKGSSSFCIGRAVQTHLEAEKTAATLSFDRPEEISDYYMEDMRHLEQEEIRHVPEYKAGLMVRDQIIQRDSQCFRDDTP